MMAATKQDRRRRRKEKAAARDARSDVELTYPVVCSPDRYEEAHEFALAELMRLGGNNLASAPHVRTYFGAGQVLPVLFALHPTADPDGQHDRMIEDARTLGDTAVLHLATARLKKGRTA